MKGSAKNGIIKGRAKNGMWNIIDYTCFNGVTNDNLLSNEMITLTLNFSCLVDDSQVSI